ncbi:MAG TPA: TetR/AcrR family transcriptional regulator [Acidimicrobiia bacterium]|nr:TetR/AcrR family transcriptional regulator [Acidimicrobiia bacterium]
MVAAQRSPERAPGTPAAERELRARGRRTMAKLLDAGMAVLGEHGYHATRVDDIVRRARTSHGTFYLYFANKEDLVRTLGEECVDEITRVVNDLGPVDRGPGGVAELREWLGRWKATYERYGPVIRAWMEDHVPDKALVQIGGRAYQEISRALRARIAEAAPSHVDPKLAAIAMLAMIERAFYYVLSRSLAIDEEELLDTLAVMIHRGFFGGDGA